MLCGYDEYLAALQFHHLDPEEKSFGIAEAGVTRSSGAVPRGSQEMHPSLLQLPCRGRGGRIALPLESETDPEPE